MPTSCISVRRKELSKIFKIISFKLFPDVWLDFRINIYAKYLIKNNFYLKKILLSTAKLTQMCLINLNIYQKIGGRRDQAHELIKYFFKKNDIKHNKNLDYFLTKFINC